MADDDFADVNGTGLFYKVHGTGHPLILIHGSLLDHRMWDRQVGAFAKLTYPHRTTSLIVVSACASGSPSPPEEEPVEQEPQVKPQRVWSTCTGTATWKAAKNFILEVFSEGIDNATVLRRMLDDYTGWHLMHKDPARSGLCIDRKSS